MLTLNVAMTLMKILPKFKGKIIIWKAQEITQSPKRQEEEESQ